MWHSSSQRSTFNHCRPLDGNTLMDSSPRITRRGFLAGAAFGLAAGAPLAWLAARRLPTFSGHSTEDKQPEYAMPGRFKGRVIRVHNPSAVRPKDSSLDAEVVRK